MTQTHTPWIEHNGGGRPHPASTYVRVKFKNGGIMEGLSAALLWPWAEADDDPAEIPNPDIIAWIEIPEPKSLKELAAASYDKHCGPNAIACAEGDLLGEALAALSECVDFHGDDESPELDWPHLRRARAILLKAQRNET